ncbi:MAG: DNA repair protein RecO (recombination protein O) [Oleiphilaceae bacterium]|jgi:DNA repair protein RecO (recombination protein O)
MKQMNQEAVYILNRRVYKESSLLLDAFSPNYGRLSIVANSVLKSNKGWSAILQVFQPLLMIWTGKSSLKTLVSVDAPSPAITLHGYRLFSAYYLNELLLKLMPQDQASSSTFTYLFINYAKSLQGLSSSTDIEIPLREFEYYLLTDLGVFPDITNDIYGDLIEADRWYQFKSSMGFEPILNFESSSKMLSSAYLLGENLTKLDSFSSEMYTDKQFMLQMKRLMRVLIHDLLGGKELKSRVLFKSYQPFRSSK